MKFYCDNCQAKYSISDEKVRGKVLKVRCKKCSHVITVRDKASAASAQATAGAKQAAGGGGASRGSARQSAPDPPAPSQPSVQWYYSVNGQSFGPLPQQQLEQKFASGELGDATYLWNETFSDWKPVSSVKVFAEALQRAAGGKRPPRRAPEPAGESRQPREPSPEDRSTGREGASPGARSSAEPEREQRSSQLQSDGPSGEMADEPAKTVEKSLSEELLDEGREPEATEEGDEQIGRTVEKDLPDGLLDDDDDEPEAIEEGDEQIGRTVEKDLSDGLLDEDDEFEPPADDEPVDEARDDAAARSSSLPTPEALDKKKGDRSGGDRRSGFLDKRKKRGESRNDRLSSLRERLSLGSDDGDEQPDDERPEQDTDEQLEEKDESDSGIEGLRAKLGAEQPEEESPEQPWDAGLQPEESAEESPEESPEQPLGAGLQREESAEQPLGAGLQPEESAEESPDQPLGAGLQPEESPEESPEQPWDAGLQPEEESDAAPQPELEARPLADDEEPSDSLESQQQLDADATEQLEEGFGSEEKDWFDSEPVGEEEPEQFDDFDADIDGDAEPLEPALDDSPDQQVSPSEHAQEEHEPGAGQEATHDGLFSGLDAGADDPVAPTPEDDQPAGPPVDPSELQDDGAEDAVPFFPDAPKLGESEEDETEESTSMSRVGEITDSLLIQINEIKGDGRKRAVYGTLGILVALTVLGGAGYLIYLDAQTSDAGQTDEDSGPISTAGLERPEFGTYDEEELAAVRVDHDEVEVSLEGGDTILERGELEETASGGGSGGGSSGSASTSGASSPGGSDSQLEGGSAGGESAGVQPGETDGRIGDSGPGGDDEPSEEQLAGGEDFDPEDFDGNSALAERMGSRRGDDGPQLYQGEDGELQQEQPEEGLTQQQINDGLASVRDSVGQCRESHHVNEGTLEVEGGEVDLTLMISPTGNVGELRMEPTSELDGTRFERCMQQHSSRWHFGRPGESVNIEAPFAL